jgi:hypothetical protein
MPLMRLTGMNPYTAEDEERIRVLAATILAEERLGHISAKLAGKWDYDERVDAIISEVIATSGDVPGDLRRRIEQLEKSLEQGR